jgi:hypothetical protein
LERHAPVAADEVQPIRPAAICRGDSIVEPTLSTGMARRMRKAQVCATASRSSSVAGSWTPHIGAAVAPEHPAVLGMNLLEVDDKVRDVLAVPALELLERAQLDAKPRSGVGDEN